MVITPGREGLKLAKSLNCHSKQPIHFNTPEAAQGLIITPLIDRLFLPLFEPDSNSRCGGQF